MQRLVLLCSPDSKGSEYVDLEVAAFLESKGLESITFVLCRGELADALPPSLANMDLDPLYIDMRDTSGKAFQLASLRLIAALYEVDFNELRREDDAHGRRIRTRWFLAALLSTVVLVSGYLIASTSPDAWERLPQPDASEQFEWREGALPVHDIAVSAKDTSIILYDGRNASWTGDGGESADREGRGGRKWRAARRDRLWWRRVEWNGRQCPSRECPGRQCSGRP